MQPPAWRRRSASGGSGAAPPGPPSRARLRPQARGAARGKRQRHSGRPPVEPTRRAPAPSTGPSKPPPSRRRNRGRVPHAAAAVAARCDRPETVAGVAVTVSIVVVSSSSTRRARGRRFLAAVNPPASDARGALFSSRARRRGGAAAARARTRARRRRVRRAGTVFASRSLGSRLVYLLAAPRRRSGGSPRADPLGSGGGRLASCRARERPRVEPVFESADARGTADVTDLIETSSIFPRVSRIVSSTADSGCGR